MYIIEETRITSCQKALEKRGEYGESDRGLGHRADKKPVDTVECEINMESMASNGCNYKVTVTQAMQLLRRVARAGQ